MDIVKRIDSPTREVSYPTDAHECLTDDDNNMMPLWFGMPMVLINNDCLSN